MPAKDTHSEPERLEPLPLTTGYNMRQLPQQDCVERGLEKSDAPFPWGKWALDSRESLPEQRPWCERGATFLPMLLLYPYGNAAPS